MSVVELTDEELASIIAGSREKGAYDRYLLATLADEAFKARGIMGDFEGKKVASVGIGFRNAAKKDDFKAKVRVVVKSDEVYLIRL